MAKKKPIVVAICGNKGGIGKTVTACSLTDALANVLGFKTLLIDADEQSNIRTTLGLKPLNIEAGLSSILLNDLDPKAVAVNVRKNIDVILSGGRSIKDFDKTYSSAPDAELLMRRRFEDTVDYDYIVIDCPPSLSLILSNVVAFADYLIIPCAPDLLSLVGVKNTINFLDNLREHFVKKNMPMAKVAGVVPTMHELRRNIDRGIIDDLMSLADHNRLSGGMVFDPIKSETKVKTSQFKKKFLSECFPSSHAAQGYKKLAEDFVELIRRNHPTTKVRNKSPHAGVIEAEV